jgi:glyoxylase-like metal-dependent hydrolase (beta-lactamase superfamily II)
MGSGGNSESAPAPDEVEVSIFGPGFGECIVVHFGNGDWGVVDSCLNPDSKRPAALHYLESLNVNVGQSVRLVVATHWHDDHLQGISSVFQAAESAVFACTGAVREPDFETILAFLMGTRSLIGGSGVDELRNVVAELKKRMPISRTGPGRISFS